jgi:hypothetical protein
MARLIFIADEKENREASKIQFTVPNDMDIWEFKRVCIRMASAMGYTSLSTKKAFGNEYKSEQDKEIIEKLQAIYSGSYA